MQILRLLTDLQITFYYIAYCCVLYHVVFINALFSLLCCLTAVLSTLIIDCFSNQTVSKQANVTD